MIRLLASVATIEEATIAARGGADLVDLKDPHQGALGALSEVQIRRILGSLKSDRESNVLTSATTGDEHHNLEQWVSSAERVTKTGVDYTKVALQSNLPFIDVCEALGSLNKIGNKLILVVFADDDRVPHELDDIVEAAGRCGLHGIMIDTADKSSGSLRDVMTDQSLTRFVTRAKSHNLLTGLAGSLQLADIPPLVDVGPDYLGFRGALCAGAERTQSLDAHCMARVRESLSQACRQRAPHAVAGATG